MVVDLELLGSLGLLGFWGLLEEGMAEDEEEADDDGRSC